MTGEEWAALFVCLVILFLWRPKPTNPCNWCHLDENRRDDCRSWCGAYREFRDYTEGR